MSHNDGFPKIGAPALRALQGNGIKTLKDLTKYSEEEISDLHGMGPKALSMLKVALSEKGLSFEE
jgi:DNA-directed RNA polymerase alpha subunit